MSDAQGSTSSGLRPQAEVVYSCARRRVVVPDARPGGAGAITRCPGCGDATTLPPRCPGDPVKRVFEIRCGRVR
jgi:hypothetical protein